MKRLWNVVNGLAVKRNVKIIVFLLIFVAVNICIGMGLWLLFGRILFPGLEWLFCFMGYPAIFVGFFGGVIYIYKHEFA
ncbi:MAG: hypothetical protein E7307_07520 [Butyrivibrio sp.]|jgi:hypothetical protein|nr:hypothetical protein [Butyrivibrio sp.]